MNEGVGHITNNFATNGKKRVIISGHGIYKINEDRTDLQIEGEWSFGSDHNDIWYLKTSTGLSEEEEKFLRLYSGLSKQTQQEERDRKSRIENKIIEHIEVERTRLFNLLSKSREVESGDTL